MSLSCWVILNLGCTRYPILFVDWDILTSKLPSPVTNPDIQLGSGISWLRCIDLFIGIILLNWDCNILDNPRFTDAFILNISIKPSFVS